MSNEMKIEDDTRVVVFEVTEERKENHEISLSLDAKSFLSSVDPVPVPIDSAYNSLPNVENQLVQLAESEDDDSRHIILSELEFDSSGIYYNNDESNAVSQIGSVTQDSLEGLQVHPQDVAIVIEIAGESLRCTRCSREFQNHRGFKVHIRSCNPDASQEGSKEGNDGSNEFGKKETAKTATNKQCNRSRESNITSNKTSSLRCKPCKRKFRLKKSYLKHEREMHTSGKNAIACEQCSVRCSSQKILDEHMTTHRSKKVECECGLTFSRKYHLTRHFRQTGCNGQKTIAYSCDVCDARFGRKDNLMAHLRWHIKRANTEIECKKCDSKHMSFTALLRHHMKDHEGNKYTCNTCGSTVHSRVAFMKHLYTHKERGFKCTHCNSSFKSPEVLKRHGLKHSAVKPLQCSLCPRTFIQPHELEAHMFIHTGRSKYYCKSCDIYFSSRSTQKAHDKRQHGGSTLRCPEPECKMAKKSFVTEQSLRIHMKMHNEDKPFKCSHCDKRFHVQAAMRSHELTHDFQQPRRCPHCQSGRAYIRGDLLIRHVRIKHPDQYSDCLYRVRIVLGKVEPTVLAKPTKQELDAMLQMLEAQVDNKVEGAVVPLPKKINQPKSKPQRAEMKREVVEDASAVMSEEQLASNIEQMLERLVDADTLECLGWPAAGVDGVLSSVLEQCGVEAADTDAHPRATCLRENTKQLFLRVIEDETLARMMSTSTVDEVIRHVVTAAQ